MEEYERVLTELGALLKIELKSDDHNTCLLEIEGGLQLYLEPSKTSDELIIGAPISEVAPGKGRELCFRSALMHNGKLTPHSGVFGYSEHANKLVLFERVSLIDLTGEALLNIILPLVEKAQQWQKALASGRVPPPPETEKAT